jgi:hypothetical protein
MRHFLCSLLLTCAGAVTAQVERSGPWPIAHSDPDVLQGAAAWLVGDHVKARQHFGYAAQRGHPLGQYNLAMMLRHREGGACSPAVAAALLRKAAESDVSLARQALEPENLGRLSPCPVPGQRIDLPKHTLVGSSTKGP